MTIVVKLISNKELLSNVIEVDVFSSSSTSVSPCPVAWQKVVTSKSQKRYRLEHPDFYKILDLRQWQCLNYFVFVFFVLTSGRNRKHFNFFTSWFSHRIEKKCINHFMSHLSDVIQTIKFYLRWYISNISSSFLNKWYFRKRK